MPGILSLVRNIFEDSRELRLLSDTHGCTHTGLESPTTSEHHLHLPEVRAPSQYLIEMGFQPTLARQLSKTYMDFVARYRNACQSHFDRATHGGRYVTEYHREVFVVLFRRTVQAWDSRIASIVRVRLCQAGASQTTVHPERVHIRVDDAAKAEIVARLGLKENYLSSDRVVAGLSIDIASRLEEMSEQTHAPSSNTFDSRLMLSKVWPISSTENISRPLDPFSQPTPPTCFPAPYPPPPERPSSYSPQRALATSFVPLASPQNVRPLTSYDPDLSSLTDLFGRMTVTTLKTDSTNSKRHRTVGIFEFDKIQPDLSPITANCAKEPRPASIESITCPKKSTTTVRRRKIAALPTRRGKTSVSPSPPVFDSVGATSYPIPRPYERIVEGATAHTLTSPPKSRLVSALSSSYTEEAPCFATPKSSTHRERKVHTLRKTLPQTQLIPQDQTLRPLVTAGETFSYNVLRPPPLVSDATSYFDSPPTSSDELDTPPSTPPSSHVLLASTSTESLAISSEPDRIISHKEPLGDTKLPCPRQRYRCLDFMKSGLCRDEQPLTFTFSV